MPFPGRKRDGECSERLMTRRRLEIREEALAEAIEGRRWYAQRSPTEADLFLAELDDIFDSILRSPEGWPVYTRRTRRALIHGFHT